MEKAKRVTLNGNEVKVLESLVGASQPEGEMCISFAWIMDDTKLDRKEVRKACRSLARKGLAEFYRGLFNDDGEVAGSGYCASRAGVALIESEEEESEAGLLPL